MANTYCCSFVFAKFFFFSIFFGGGFDVNLGKSEDGMEGTEKSIHISALDKYLFPFLLLRGLCQGGKVWALPQSAILARNNN